MATQKQALPARAKKAERALVKIFPDVPRFVGSRNYSALPWVFRRAQWLFQPRAWQILTYLYLRSGPEGVTWLTDKQIAVDIEIGPRKIGPQLRELEAMGFIVIKEHDGERFICIVDPVAPLRKLAKAGRIVGDKLERLNEDFAQIGIEPLDSDEPEDAL